jgi:FtsZ-binding cell division protein ZapB
MREICRCLSTFIEEQKSFNRHIEQRLTAATTTNSSVSQSIDPMFNQFQQQILTQGLIVNLNTAYREIAVLQSEINALQSENNRLTSSISFDKQYHHHQYSRDNSIESLYSFDQIKPTIRPQPRSRFDEQNQFFENPCKTSFSSQSTGKQTAIHLDKINIETTPIKHERNG